MHSSGLNFSMFNSNFLQIPSAIYPDFTYDKINDVNYGFRYATFAFETPIYEPPESYQFINITIHNPSAVGSIGTIRLDNDYLPDAPVVNSLLQYMKCRMHVLLLGSYNPSTYSVFQTEWIDCFKIIQQDIFDDSNYAIGGCVQVTQNGGDVTYTVQINRRAYTKILALVRFGISQDGSIYGGNPITFDGISVTYA